MMLRFSNTKSSMLYNLLSVDEAQMFVFEALKKTVQYMSVPVNMSVHFYTGTMIEKKQIPRKPLYCTWELNTHSPEQTSDSLHVSVVVGKLYAPPPSTPPPKT